MGFLSVGVVHRRCGVEFAGGEKFLFVDTRLLGVGSPGPRPRRDDGDAGPRMQEGAVGRAGHPVVSRLLAGQMVALAIALTSGSSFGVSVGGRSSITSSVASKSGSSEPRDDVFQSLYEISVGLIRHRTDIQGDVGARGDDVDLGLTGAWAHRIVGVRLG